MQRMEKVQDKKYWLDKGSFPENVDIHHNMPEAGGRTTWTCGDPGISSGGVQVSLTKKSSDNVFFFFFKSSAYFTEVKWSISKKSIIFQGSRGGPTFSRGPNFFQRGGGGGRDPLFPPLDPHLVDIIT